MKIVTVLRSGGDYRLYHAGRLRRQCAKRAPGVEFTCLTDQEIYYGVKLRHGWPGWWAKMEMFRPDFAVEPFLFMDLDTSIVGPLDDMLERRELTVLSDFYRPKQIQSSLMLVTPTAAALAWAAFLESPARHIRECVTPERWGDQGFLEGVWGREVARWQSVLPGTVVSYKRDCRKGIPKTADVVCFHGKPRPWEVGL